MSQQEFMCWVCDLCGHVWLQTKGKVPERCARCRKRGWEKSAPKVGKLGSENNLAETLEKVKAFERTLPQVTVKECAVGAEKVAAAEPEKVVEWSILEREMRVAAFGTLTKEADIVIPVEDEGLSDEDLEAMNGE